MTAQHEKAALEETGGRPAKAVQPVDWETDWPSARKQAGTVRWRQTNLGAAPPELHEHSAVKEATESLPPRGQACGSLLGCPSGSDGRSAPLEPLTFCALRLRSTASHHHRGTCGGVIGQRRLFMARPSVPSLTATAGCARRSSACSGHFPQKIGALTVAADGATWRNAPSTAPSASWVLSSGQQKRTPTPPAGSCSTEYLLTAWQLPRTHSVTAANQVHAAAADCYCPAQGVRGGPPFIVSLSCAASRAASQSPPAKVVVRPAPRGTPVSQRTPPPSPPPRSGQGGAPSTKTGPKCRPQITLAGRGCPGTAAAHAARAAPGRVTAAV